MPRVVYSDLYESFWKLYPARTGRKVGKQAAYQHFSKLSPDDQLLCVRAAAIYANLYKQPTNDGAFRPHPRDPERFIKKDWWREWLEPERKLCEFRSLFNPCENVAVPGDRLCGEHRAYTNKLEAARRRHP